MNDNTSNGGMTIENIEPIKIEYENIKRAQNS